MMEEWMGFISVYLRHSHLYKDKTEIAKCISVINKPEIAQGHCEHR